MDFKVGDEVVFQEFDYASLGIRLGPEFPVLAGKKGTVFKSWPDNGQIPICVQLDGYFLWVEPDAIRHAE